MGNSSIMRVCESVKRVLKSSRKNKTIIEINGFVLQDVDTIPSPCPPDLLEKVNRHGTKVKEVGRKTSKMLASRKVLEIHLGTAEEVISRCKISQNGDIGVKMSSNEIITLANSATKEEVSSIQTTLNALHITQNSLLKLAMAERYAEIVIKLRPHTASTKKRCA